MTTKILVTIVWLVCLNGCRGAESKTRLMCHSVDISSGWVITVPLSSIFEVVAGKRFAYGCEYFVETMDCYKKPNSLECDEIEVIWTLPETLENLEQERGETRLVTNIGRNTHDGYDLYRSWFNISAVGRQHEGKYICRQKLRFQDKTVNQGSFYILIIDLIQNNQRCSYSDSCESSYCVDGHCGPAREVSVFNSFPWLRVIACTIIGLVILCYCCVRRNRIVCCIGCPDDY